MVKIGNTVRVLEIDEGFFYGLPDDEKTTHMFSPHFRRVFMFNEELMDIRTISWDEALPIRHEVLWANESLLFCQVDGDIIPIGLST